MNVYGFNFYINCDNNILAKNSLLYNTEYGIILLESCTSNFVDRNQFISNNGTGVQAYDNGSSNTFGFNYWNDWTNPDIDENQIVDLPYSIEGIANNMDYYPLVIFSVKFITLINQNNNDYLQSGTQIEVKVHLPYVLDQIKYNWDGLSNITILLGSNTSNIFDTELPASNSEHTLTVYAQDDFTNWYSQKFHFFIDDDKPIIINNEFDNDTYQRSGYLINLSVGDDLAGISRVWYMWDNNGTFYSLFDPYTLPLISSDGWHTLAIYANDTAGNVAELSLVFNTDDTPPDIELSNQLNDSVHKSGTPIDLLITNSDGNLMYHWDSDINKTVVASFDPLLPSGEGSHHLYLYASDSLGNWQSKTYYFISDNTAPDIILASPSHNAILPSRSLINLTLFDTNNISKVLFNWENTGNITLESPYDVLLATGDGEHILTVYALDEAGNWAMATFMFTTSNTSSDVFLIFFGIIGMLSLIFSLFLYRRSTRWRGMIEHIIVLTKSGLPIYNQALQKEELKADVSLAGGALVGISSLSSEITQASHLKVIKQENYCIMLEEGSKIILAVLIKEEMKSLRKRMIGFISDFESNFKELLNEEIHDSDAFDPSKVNTEKYFGD
jgi:hypothetical protein